jgi:hypothetical protein
VGELDLPPFDQARCAEILHMRGGGTSPLAICMTSDGWMSGRKLDAWAANLDEIVIARSPDHKTPWALVPGALVTAPSWVTLIRNSDLYESRWPEFGYWNDALDEVLLSSSLSPLIFSIVAGSWGLTVEQLCKRSLLSGLERQWTAVVAIADDGEELSDNTAHVLRR